MIRLDFIFIRNSINIVFNLINLINLLVGIIGLKVTNVGFNIVYELLSRGKYPILHLAASSSVNTSPTRVDQLIPASSLRLTNKIFFIKVLIFSLII